MWPSSGRRYSCGNWQNRCKTATPCCIFGTVARGREEHKGEVEQNLPFDVDALLVFGKVVESRSLSKAAALLGMPKSTVSRKLTKLEADLGIKLLRKNTHQLTVTDLGEKVYDHAVNILTES